MARKKAQDAGQSSVHIYLTADEKQRLDYYAEELGINRSKLVKAWIDERQPVLRQDPELTKQIYALRTISANLNQLAAKANSQGFITSDEYSDVRALANEIRELRVQILEKLHEPIPVVNVLNIVDHDGIKTNPNEDDGPVINNIFDDTDGDF